MTSDTRPSRGDRTRTALLAAATDRFSRDGYRATSVSDICRDAGVGPTTAYVHYPNKEGLFLAAVDADLSTLFDAIVDLVARLGPQDDLISGLFDGLLASLELHPLARRLLAGLEPAITERVLASDAFDRLREAISARMALAQRAGELRQDLDPSVFAEGLIAIVIALLMAAVQMGRQVLDIHGPGLEMAFGAMLSAEERPA